MDDLGVAVFPSGANFVLFRRCGRVRSTRLAGHSRARRAGARLLQLAASRRLPARHDRHTVGERRVPGRAGSSVEGGIEWGVARRATGSRRRRRSTSRSISTAPASPTSVPASPSTTTCSTSSEGTAASTCASPPRATCTSTPTTPSRTWRSRWGRRFAEALGDKAGVRRFASGLYPLDEALVEVALDLSGRPFVALGRRDARSAAARQPGLRPAARRARGFLVRHRGGHHPPRHAAPRHATCTTSSRPRSRASLDASAMPCASRAEACRRRRACCERQAAVSPSLDYGIGNLHSAQKALEKMGADARAHQRPGRDRRSRRGGAARRRGVRRVHDGAARGRSRASASTRAVASGRPFLGICVGMQMLFDASEERPTSPGSGCSRARSAGSRPS